MTIPTPITLDNTQLSAFMRCPRYYYYAHVEHLAPARLPEPLGFGLALARGQEVWHAERARGAEFLPALRKAIREACIVARDLEWAPEDAENAHASPWLFSSSTRSLETLLRTLVWYADRYREDAFRVLVAPHTNKPAVELSFSLDLSPSLVFCGHMDRVGEFGGSVLVGECKHTTGNIGSFYFGSFQHDAQTTGYVWAAKALGLPAVGVVLDASQVAVSFSRFHRDLIYKSAAQLQSWYDTIREVGYEIAYTRDVLSLGTPLDRSFRKNYSACYARGPCPYLPLCSAPSEDIRRAEVATSFTHRHWDPLRVR